MGIRQIDIRKLLNFYCTDCDTTDTETCLNCEKVSNIVDAIDQATIETPVGDWEKELFDMFSSNCRSESARHSCRKYLPNDEVPCMKENCPIITYIKSLLAKTQAEARQAERERIVELLDNQYETVSMWHTSSGCIAHNKGIKKCIKAIKEGE